MRIFSCSHCGQLVYFENTHCENCGHSLGFNSDRLLLETLAVNGETFVALPSNYLFKYCANHQYGVCNWLVDAFSNNIFCKACRLNKTIPDISNPVNVSLWYRVEVAKHRLVFSILKLQLPLSSKSEDFQSGLAFDLLAPVEPGQPVMTGHDEGLITINIAEADDSTLEKVRLQMGEPYRTLLGHFRHEVGHYYWNRLVQKSLWIHEFRNLFGNERADYGASLQRYYQQGAPANFRQHYITPYACSHPWEDWAETWAHYLHMMDTLETAWSFGLNINARNLSFSNKVATNIETDPYSIREFNDIVSMWLPFTSAMNSINRSMGMQDLYPFVMSREVVRKLDFIHRICREPRF